MNILRIHTAGGPAGGIEVYLGRLGAALRDRGHRNVAALISSDEPPPELGPAYSYRLPQSESRQVVDEFLQRGDLAAWLDGLVKKAQPDIIHVHRLMGELSNVVAWLERRPEPIVLTVHTAELVCPIGTLTLPDGSACPGGILPRCQFTGCAVGWGLPLNLARRRSFDRHLHPHVRRYLCTSEATRRIMDGLGYRPAELLRPPIPLPEAPLPAPPKPWTVGFLGRFTPPKGIDVLLDAFRTVRRTRPDVELRLAGSGPVAIPREPGIHLDGWVTDRGSWFSRIHVLAIPSVGWDNLPYTTLEALGFGVPVVASDSGGLPEMVEGRGTIVPQRDADALARALLATFDHLDEARHRALEGRAWVRSEFAPERHYDRLLEIYRTVIEECGRPKLSP